MVVVLSSTQLTLVMPDTPEQVGDAEMAIDAGTVSVK